MCKLFSLNRKKCVDECGQYETEETISEDSKQCVCMSTFTRDGDSCRCDGYLTKYRTLCIGSCGDHQEEVVDAET